MVTIKHFPVKVTKRLPAIEIFPPIIIANHVIRLSCLPFTKTQVAKRGWIIRGFIQCGVVLKPCFGTWKRCRRASGTDLLHAGSANDLGSSATVTIAYAAADRNRTWHSLLREYLRSLVLRRQGLVLARSARRLKAGVLWPVPYATGVA